MRTRNRGNEDVIKVLYISEKAVKRGGYPSIPKAERNLLVKGLEKVLKKSTPGPAFKGVHTCPCGVRSSNRDFYYTKNKQRYMLNSLARHYVEKHSNAISDEELEIVEKLLGE